jgi:hypothetical protein
MLLLLLLPFILAITFSFSLFNCFALVLFKVGKLGVNILVVGVS